MTSWASPALVQTLLRRASDDGNEPAVRQWLIDLHIPAIDLTS